MIETTVGGYEQLDRQAEEITRDQQGFDLNIYAQHVEMEGIRRSWSTLQDSDKKFVLQKYALLFPRTREDLHPMECLENILRLPETEDVLRALRVRSGDYQNFRSDQGDSIYPTTGWFGRYLAYAKWNKVPLALHFWAALSVLGMAVRRNYFVDNGVTRIWMNQFIVLTGPKANGKSAARETAINLLRRMNRKLDEMKESQKILSAKAFQIPIFGGDVTTQYLIKTLANNSKSNSRLVLFPSGKSEMIDGEGVCGIDADELSNLLGKGTHSALIRVPFFTEAAFQDHYHKATKSGEEENVERMAISILACTQPGWMRNTIVSDALSGGFVERANFIYRDKSVRDGLWSSVEIPILDPLVAEDLADRLVELSSQTTGPQLLQTTPQGAAYFTQWYKHQHSLGPRDKADASMHSLERRCIHLLRMAALLCVSEQETLPWIKIRHLQQAISIVEAEDEFYSEFIEQATEHSDAEVERNLLAWMKSCGGTVSRQQFANKFAKLGKVKRNEIMENLTDRGLVKGPLQGRGGTKYELTD